MRRIVFIQTLTLIEKTFSYKYHMSYKDDGNNETHNISGFTGVMFELLLWLKGIHECRDIYANDGICWPGIIWWRISCSWQLHGIWSMGISQSTNSANSRQEEILKMVFVENFSKREKVEIKEWETEMAFCFNFQMFIFVCGCDLRKGSLESFKTLMLNNWLRKGKRFSELLVQYFTLVQYNM